MKNKCEAVNVYFRINVTMNAAKARWWIRCRDCSRVSGASYAFKWPFLVLSFYFTTLDIEVWILHIQLLRSFNEFKLLTSKKLFLYWSLSLTNSSKVCWLFAFLLCKLCVLLFNWKEKKILLFKTWNNEMITKFRCCSWWKNESILSSIWS